MRKVDQCTNYVCRRHGCRSCWKGVTRASKCVRWYLINNSRNFSLKKSDFLRKTLKGKYNKTRERTRNAVSRGTSVFHSSCGKYLKWEVFSLDFRYKNENAEFFNSVAKLYQYFTKKLKGHEIISSSLVFLTVFLFVREITGVKLCPLTTIVA